MPQRIVIVGNSATGKSTLARALAAQLGCPHIERDAIQWQAGWQGSTDEAFRAQVSAAIQGDCWVADGNFSRARDMVWGRADTLIWLDYPLWVILWRLTRRSWARIRNREVLWNGNRETWWHLLAGNGVYAWTWKAHFRHRHEYPILLREARFQHLTVIRLRSARATQEWVDQYIIGEGHHTKGQNQ